MAERKDMKLKKHIIGQQQHNRLHKSLTIQDTD